MLESKLIILRGNSGCGKSSTAKLLRDMALQAGETNIAIVEQDYIRRIILKEKETEGINNIDLIQQTVEFALSRGYTVILEGILYSSRYSHMIDKLVSQTTSSFIYYFQTSFEETLRRHSTKSNAHEFGESEMRQWYREADELHVKDERLIPERLSQDQTLKLIFSDVFLSTTKT